MKKLGLALLILNTSLAFSSDWACMHLKITIQNNTQDTCHLLQNDLTSGQYVTAFNDLPFDIKPGQKSSVLETKEGLLGTASELALTYQCGDNKFVTFKSTQNACLYSGIIESSILSISNMDATAFKYPGSYAHNRSGMIYWTLS